jgi:mono/diheme cytochrome c family protein
MSGDVKRLLGLTQEELDELFRNSPPGEIPTGRAEGTAIVFPGSLCARVIARLVTWFWWQGKVFDRASGTLLNLISCFRIRAIKARVYAGTSWLDGKPTIVLDYSTTSLVARKIRDEIREIEPGLYLGKVYWGRKRIADFCVVPLPKAARTSDALARCLSGFLVVLLAAGLYVWYRLNIDTPVAYGDIEEHFKYGSTGGEREAGIPYSIWRVLPEMFPEYLPGQGYASIGFVFEPGRDLPVGVSRRNYQGIDRVFLNCGVCHTGTVRDRPDAPPRVYTGMPGNTVDLEKFQEFLLNCATDQKFTPQRVLLELDRRGLEPDPINRLALRYFGVNRMREQLLMLRQRLHSFTQREPEFGPGRFDTFNPAKIYLNFPMDKLPEREWVGIADFPSIWLQGQRQDRHMQLHWDGNNTEVTERNKSAAFGTGTTPPTIDLRAIGRIEDWLLTLEPPAYPYPIDQSLAQRGAPIYQQHCAECHGRNGRDFEGTRVGTVEPIAEIGTDPHRLDSYTRELCTAQNTIYAGYPWRFSHFRKTFGYANQPLDGVWLRGPYLHNGAVPTLRDLLQPADRRPRKFFRGYNVYDPIQVGFVSNVDREGAHQFFEFDTSRPGNGNQGHTGLKYGTELPDTDKDALLEYLKTF